VTGATSVVSMADLFGLYLQGGLVDVALLGAAQIDRFGNLNTSVIGDYSAPRVRLPGSGGACEIAINAGQIFVIMRLGKRSFVKKLDFLTSPGHLDGGDARARLGLAGKGPTLVVTDMAIFDFNNPQREMQLVSLHPGVALDHVRAEMDWEGRMADNINETPMPTPEELHIVRDNLDPQGIYRR
jgi:glutaconate CoA-transferase subunit B